MATRKRSGRAERCLWTGKGQWEGWKLESWNRKGYEILNLTRPKHTPFYSIMSSPNVVRLALKKGRK